MTIYYVWINCTAGIHETPKECGPDVTNCGQVHFLKFESNDPQKDLEKIRKGYTVPICPIGKVRRYLATTSLETAQINGQEPLTIDNLILKRRDIGTILQESRFPENE